MTQKKDIRRHLRRQIILPIAFILLLCSFANTILFYVSMPIAISMLILFGAFLLIAFRDEDHKASRILSLIVVIGCLSYVPYFLSSRIDFNLYNGGLWGHYIIYSPFDILYDYLSLAYINIILSALLCLTASVVVFANAKRGLYTRLQLRSNMEADIKQAISAASNENKKSHETVASINNELQETHGSVSAKETLAEAGAMVIKPYLIAQKSDKLIERVNTITARKTTVRSLNKALRISKKAELISLSSTKELGAARILYDKAMQEEASLSKLKDGANTAVSQANNATRLAKEWADNAEKVAETSTTAKELAWKASIAANNAADTLNDILPLAEAVSLSTTAQDAKKNEPQINALIHTIDAYKQEAKRLLEQVKEEEETLGRKRNEADVSAQHVKVAMDKVVSQAAKYSIANCTTKAAKEAILRAASEVENAKRAAAETYRFTAQAAKAASSQAAWFAASKANKFADKVFTSCGIINDLFTEAENEEAKYQQAEKDITAAKEKANKSVESAASYANKMKELLHVSNQAAYEAATHTIALIAEITACIAQVQNTDSVQIAQSTALTATDFARKAASYAESAKVAYETAAVEDDRINRDIVAMQGTAQDKYEHANWYLNQANVEQYIHWLEQAAEGGYVNAQKDLGFIYLDGIIEKPEKRPLVLQLCKGLRRLMA